MKEVRDTIKEVQYRRLLKRSFAPRKEFVERSRAAFLEEVAKRRVEPFAPQIPWRVIGVRSVRFFGVFAAIALLSTSGLVAFADSQNVQATHPLYPLKRIGEQVRLSVTPQQDAHLLHEEFAKRRAEEVRQISAIAQTETDGARQRHEEQIKNIKHEFKKDIAAIAAIPEINNKLSPMRIEALCNTKAEIEDKIGDDDDTPDLRKFDEWCVAIANGNNIVATSTIQMSPLENNGGDLIQARQKFDSRNGLRVE